MCWIGIYFKFPIIVTDESEILDSFGLHVSGAHNSVDDDGEKEWVEQATLSDSGDNIKRWGRAIVMDDLTSGAAVYILISVLSVYTTLSLS